MGKKATKKFASSGRLKKTIEARHKSKQFKKKFTKANRPVAEDDEDSEKEDSPKSLANRYTKFLGNIFDWNLRYSTKRMTVDSFLSGNFIEESGGEGIEVEDVSPLISSDRYLNKIDSDGKWWGGRSG